MSYSRVVEQGYLSFVKGLATELSPLSTPEEYAGTTADELNMAVDTEGMVRVRRKGVDVLPLAGTLPGVVHDTKFWRPANCYVAVSSTAGPSQTTRVHISLIGKSGATSLYTVQLQTSDFVPPSISFLRSKCVISSGGRPLLLTKEPTGRYTFQYINLYIRDFRAYPDGLTVTENPSVLEDEHKYNLYNAGWYQNRALLSSGAVGDPVQDFFAVRTKYPSNADVPYLGDITDSNGDLKFDPKAFDNVNVGSTEAPRGHYVYSIRDIDRQAKLTNKDNDGAPLSSLTTIMLDGKHPITGFDVGQGVLPIDVDFPDTTPGVIIP